MRLTKHAIERALDMAVPGSEIRDCYQQPTEKKWNPKYGCSTYSRGRLALSVRFDEDTQEDVIVTILWANQEAWEADYKYGSVEGRAPRSDMNHLRRR